MHTYTHTHTHHTHTHTHKKKALWYCEFLRGFLDVSAPSSATISGPRVILWRMHYRKHSWYLWSSGFIELLLYVIIYFLCVCVCVYINGLDRINFSLLSPTNPVPKPFLSFYLRSPPFCSALIVNSNSKRSRNSSSSNRPSISHLGKANSLL